jgi:hypothetical protein
MCNPTIWYHGTHIQIHLLYRNKATIFVICRQITTRVVWDCNHMTGNRHFRTAGLSSFSQWNMNKLWSLIIEVLNFSEHFLFRKDNVEFNVCCQVLEQVNPLISPLPHLSYIFSHLFLGKYSRVDPPLFKNIVGAISM